VFDIEKIARSIVAFSDYFSLRILLLLLSCYLIYYYTWSHEYVVLASQVYSELVKVVDAFSNDTLLKLFKLELIVPFLSLFLLISLLDLHMKLLTAVSGILPFRFAWSFSGNYVVAINEPNIFHEWTKVSGVHDWITYRGMIISDFYDNPPAQSYTFGTLLSLITYLRSYGIILFFCGILFPGLFVNDSRWRILMIAFVFVLVSVFGELIGQLLGFIKGQQEEAGNFYNYIRKYNSVRQIAQIKQSDRIESEARPKLVKEMEAFELFIPSIRIEFLLPIWVVGYDLRSAWSKIKKRLLRPTK
jgi:hypothetical protein